LEIDSIDKQINNLTRWLKDNSPNNERYGEVWDERIGWKNRKQDALKNLEFLKSNQNNNH
jgi:hypothetical protein